MFIRSISTITKLLNLILVLCVTCGVCYSQTITTSNTDGSTPLGLSPGSPAGSYALSGFENINNYNGNFNIHIPLLHIAGRGDAGTNLTLGLNTKRWRVVDNSVPDLTEEFRVVDKWWDDPLKPGYGPGVLQGRQGMINNIRCTYPLPPSAAE